MGNLRPALPLLAIWACFLIRGFFYSAMLPLWEGWDEWSHFAYVQHFANTGELPVPEVTRPSREIQESLALAPLPWTLRHTSRPHDAFWTLPASERVARTAALGAIPPLYQRQEAPRAEPLYESQQPPLYYWLLYPPLRLVEDASLPSRVFLLRVFSVALASLAIPAGFAIARRAFGSRAMAAGIVAMATVMPVSTINLSRVGNDSLSLVIYTLLLYLALRMVEEPGRLRAGLLFGAVLGGGLLTKTYFLTALVAAAILCAWSLAGHWARRKRIVAAWAVACGTAILLSGWWYRFIYAATGTFTGQVQTVAARSATLGERLRAILEVDWLRAFDAMLVSHIWFGASSFLQVRSWIYHFFGGLFLLSAAGLVLLLAKRKRTAIERYQDRVAVPALGLFLALFLLSVLYHVLVTFLRTRQSMSNGWYFYCLVFPEVILVSLGLMAICPSGWRRWVIPGGAALFAALDVYGVNFILIPYYHGLIAHAPDGRLQNFHLGQLAGGGFTELISRLEVNRPFLGGAEGFLLLWVLYVAATLACPVAAFALARRATPS
jgi:4-amino-4-deoxy-L-arabinose transferase-like glycosyltransferase